MYVGIDEDYLLGRTENLHDYLIPTIGDVPRFAISLPKWQMPRGLRGPKGLVSMLIPTAPAIVNARQVNGADHALPSLPIKFVRHYPAGKELTS